MRLKVRRFEVMAGRPIVFIQHDDAARRDIGVGDRVQISRGARKIQARVDIMSTFLVQGEAALSDDILSALHVRPGMHVDVSLMPSAESALFIMRKMKGKALAKTEIRAVVEDIVHNALTEAEIAAFIVSVYRNGMTRREIIDLTEAMCSTGKILAWHSPIIADKHCIGGIAGNRTTPLVVAVCASAGIVMPKTSSRAITSAAGTADSVESVMRVDFPAHELQRIVRRTGACLAWGGSLGLAPADDKLIRIERILRLDPDAQLIASILSKKIAAGSTHVVIDIPHGEGAKVTKERAERLRTQFLDIGRHFGLALRVLLTDGRQPIGNGIGPVLEMQDVLRVLRQENPPKDLQEKALMLSGAVIELVHKVSAGKGKDAAREILTSGRALRKFEEIAIAQGRTGKELRPAKLKKDLFSPTSGSIAHLDNTKINSLATMLGCPADKGAGISLHKHAGERVRKGERLMTFYSESSEKMEEALHLLKKEHPATIRSS